MDTIANIIIFVAVIASIIIRAKKAQERTRAGGGQTAAPDFKSKILEGFVVPANKGGEANISLPPLGLAGKQLDKIVKVYGTGAMLGTDEVSILLNVSPETTQDYLEQLASSNRAIKTSSASGKMRYKLL
jgi:hypothetical protein